MSAADVSTRIGHMIEAAEKAIAFSAGQTRQGLEANEMLALALVRLLEIVGEAAQQVTSETKVRYPDIPWKLAAATRDRLIHGYFNVDLDVVWAILTDDLPPLIEQLKTIDLS